MRKRRTEIIVETHELRTVRVFNLPRPAWCLDCVGASRMLPPEEVAAVCRVSPRAVYGWAEARRVHFKQAGEGGLLVCLHSCLAVAGAAPGGNV